MRDEIHQLRAFRASTPEPDAAAWSRAERAISEARQQPAHRLRTRRLSRWRMPTWRVLGALSALPVAAVAALIAVLLSSGPATTNTDSSGLSWSLAGYFVPEGYQLSTHGPAPGPLTCPSATTCYDQADLVPHQVADGRLVRRTYQWDDLYVSKDGAHTWQAVRLPDGLAFTSRLVCQTADTCSAGAIDHGTPAFTVTRDGGRTWTTSPLPAGTGRITVLTCPAATTCRALANVGGSLIAQHLVTTDGGRHFTVSSFPAVDSISQLSCPTVNHCIAAGRGTAYDISFTGLVLVSNDGGVTWRPGTLPRAMTADSPIDCVDAEHCFAAGLHTIGTYHDGVTAGITKLYDEMLASDDGGVTWTVRPLSARFPSPLIDNVACVSASTCYITGSDSVAQSFDNGKATSGGSYYAAVTQDAGLTWQAMSMAEPPSSQLQPGEPPDVFMSVSSLQCPQVNVCIAMADNVAGNKHAAIYTTAP